MTSRGVQSTQPPKKPPAREAPQGEVAEGEMINGSRSAAQELPADHFGPTLREWPQHVINLACDLCQRRGQYLKAMLIARFGGDVLLSDLRYKIAHCVCKHASAHE
jgi:hypothetical protein